MQHPFIVLESIDVIPQSRKSDEVRYSPTDFKPGDTLIITYNITNHENYPVMVWLGASLLNEKGEEYSESAQDMDIELNPGEHEFHRSLSVPLGWSAKKTTLAVAVYLGKAEEHSYKRLADFRKDLTV